ncbi:MAG: hypothetical protein HYV09_40365 [Deltaproteobacteria bacterium]|nr:hypothetical protein [Deltaproteobacteria bacterium]
MRSLMLGLFVSFVAACGATPAPPPPVAPKAEPAPAPVAAEPAPKDAVRRSVVDAAIKSGLGKFLANLDVEAQLEKGKFVGWKIVELRGAMWEGVDLRPGDVVTRVNGFKIERDHEANAAFKSLAVASEIRVTVLRDGHASEIRFAIVEGE